jgi:hypothetical protein
MLGDVRESPSSSFLYSGIELFEADDQSFKSSRVNYSFGKLRRVFGNGSKHECGCFLIESLNELKVTFCSFRDMTS